MPEQFMTQADYARYRGVSRQAINQAAGKGLVVMNDEGLVDVEATDQHLAESLNPIKAGGEAVADRAAYLAAKTRESEARATLAELEAQDRAGRLCEAEEVEAEAFALARQALESLLAIPDRLASVLSAETDAARIHKMLDDEIRHAIEAIQQRAESAENSAALGSGE